MAANDHLAELMFNGGGPSHGIYTPERVTLTLAGRDQLTDHVVYLHEVHHRGLNDSTAWGVVLHLFADLPEPRHRCFLPLLDACRLPHEAFATFASVNVAAARHPDAAAVLETYPQYAPLYRALSELASAGGGPHREYLLATALARVAMQTPVLDALLESSDFSIVPSDLRAVDTPNGRWRWLLQHSGDLVIRAAADADAALGDPVLLEHDDGRHEDISDPANDSQWERWEQTAYATLAGGLRVAGATPLEYNGHMTRAPEAVARALELAPSLRMRAAAITDPAPDDRSLAGATIERVRLTLAEPPYPARLLSVDPSQVVDEVDDRCRIAGQPGFVLSARFPSRLRDGYRWGSEDRRRLEEMQEPMVAARVIEAEEGERSEVAHLVIPDPAALSEITAQWDGRGPVASVLSAGVLLDRSWQERWIAPLREFGPLVVLVDIALDRFVNGWVSAELAVRGGLIQVTDTSGGFWALGLCVEGREELWLALADEITLRLLLEQLRRTPGIQLTDAGDRLDPYTDILPVVITHLLATESFLDLEGLDEATLARFRDS
jgi:hypothetical protein